MNKTAILLLGLLSMGCERHSQTQEKEPIFSAIEILRETADIPFEKAQTPRPFVFPNDHFSHPSFKTEWWYWTGNLSSKNKPYAYQLTFFRTSNGLPLRQDPWNSSQSWMGHFALAQLSEGGRFLTQERFERGGAVSKKATDIGPSALAGADTTTAEIFLHHWNAKILKLDPLTIELSAFQDNITGISLRLTAQKPIVLQGDRGLSWKNQDRTNASYYYSSTRMKTEGTITIDGQPLDVQGVSWFDREWSSGSLDKSQTGWDWFSLHLDDGSDVMLFQIRQTTEGKNYASGTLVSPAGPSKNLDPKKIELKPEGSWISPKGSKYPASWVVSWEGQESLRIRPSVADQEWRHRFRYWEGSVHVETLSGKKMGVGFLEMTGYGPPRP